MQQDDNTEINVVDAVDGVTVESETIYRAVTPVATPEPAQPVQTKAVSKPDSEGVDPHEITHLTPEKTPAEKPVKRSSGGVLKWILGGIVVFGTLAGVGYAAG